MSRPSILFTSLAALSFAAGVAGANEPIRLRESFVPGYQYHVSSRVELTGSLSLPPEKERPGQQRTLTLTGKSAIEYDERVLAEGKDGKVHKTARLYRRIDLERKVGDQVQQTTLRPAVRRLVLLRHNQSEVPFSPDGPLTWDEIDLVRTDVFTPALLGLLPERPVRPGERWNAATAAIQELTDLERIEEGTVVCTFEQMAMLSNRRHARVGFRGTVRGIGEDGANRQQLDGYLFFDLESSHVSYLSLRGVQEMLDKEGKVAGKVAGTFVLTRQPKSCRELGDEALRGVATEPTEANTLLLYDNAELGVRFVHPRRWRVAGVRGRQVGLDENRGSGLLLTLEPLKQATTAAAFLQESQTFWKQQKATVLRVQQPRAIQGAPRPVDQFALEVEVNRQRLLMDYYVLRQAGGGATIAARLLPADLPGVQRDVEQIARSIEIMQQQ